MNEIVIFDLDNTLIEGQSQELLLSYLLKRGLIGYPFYLKLSLWFLLYKVGLTKKPREMMEYAVSFLKDMPVKEFEIILDDFFEERLKNSIYPEAKEILEKHMEEKRRVMVVSNAISYIPRKVSEYLNIEYFIGTEVEIKGDRLTGRLTGDIAYGINKPALIKEYAEKNGLSLDNAWGYSDHISDMPMLEMVKRPFAVNPCASLRKEAEKRNWPILTFKMNYLKRY